MLIGLTGLAGAGKSEVAGYLAQHHGFRRVAFADPLKSMLLAAGFSRAQVYGDLKGALDERFGVTPRRVMQTLGTEWGREMAHPDIWVRLWAEKVADPLAHGVFVVAEDVRFENEAARIRELGGQVWEITRPGIDRMGHVSENHEIEPDARIHNVAGLFDLFLSVDALLGAPEIAS